MASFSTVLETRIGGRAKCKYPSHDDNPQLINISYAYTAEKVPSTESRSSQQSIYRKSERRLIEDYAKRMRSSKAVRLEEMLAMATSMRSASSSPSIMAFSDVGKGCIPATLRPSSDANPGESEWSARTTSWTASAIPPKQAKSTP